MQCCVSASFSVRFNGRYHNLAWSYLQIYRMACQTDCIEMKKSYYKYITNFFFSWLFRAVQAGFSPLLSSGRDVSHSKSDAPQLHYHARQHEVWMGLLSYLYLNHQKLSSHPGRFTDSMAGARYLLTRKKQGKVSP